MPTKTSEPETKEKHSCFRALVLALASQKTCGDSVFPSVPYEKTVFGPEGKMGSKESR